MAPDQKLFHLMAVFVLNLLQPGKFDHERRADL